VKGQHEYGSRRKCADTSAQPSYKKLLMQVVVLEIKTGEEKSEQS
jgi:hypothetical protein